ncbi:aspartyl protease family protein [Nitrospirillum amazonense]|uniref:aspartyl protease family protein n=1 Tax=Nitrospirillum amazonense TaxID=28077 RepID=UPI002DD427E8|nr:aspartyl protease family protein [Nitrospirillum amazonense]MEC4594260.1 aspartyl protease family protein [Nitrospirillum amazonense]
MSGAIPFDYASQQAPLIVVEGQLGEQAEKGRIVVDTGATAPFPIFLSVSRAQRLHLPLSGDVTPESSTAIGGGPQTYREGELPAFSIGPVKLEHAKVAVLPMIDAMTRQVGTPIDGIVGYQFLRNYRFSIDYVAHQIDFAAAMGRDADALSFSLGLKKPLILVQATVNGTGPFTFEIDTGATVTTLSPEAAERAGVVATGDGVLGGAGGTVAVRRGDARVTLGPVSYDLRNLSISDRLSAISSATGSTVEGILGLDFLYRTRLTIDYPSAKVWIVGTSPSRTQ